MRKIEGTEPANYLQLNLFPSIVEPKDDEQLYEGKTFKVLVTNNYFYGVLEAVSGPYYEIKEPLVSFDILGKGEYTVVTETNKYLVKKDANCGCGSRLRGVNPFVSLPYIAKPRKK